ncbi:MAG: L-threonylcarbamoyladenylate synthase [Pseudomonadota bacterium]
MKTDYLKPDRTGIERAVAFWRAGEAVAFPTETVYGLGADAHNDRAVAKIFDAKSRPSFNPLIAHVATVEAATTIGHIPDAAQQYLANGWPPGLTLVVPLQREAGISRLVTAGQDTIALRVPTAPLARDLLTAFGGPVAAPSANPSGRISPTSAAHVRAGLDRRIAAVIEGGTTAAGLESTILGFDAAGPLVLREGAYEVPDTLRRATEITRGHGPVAPGQLSSHYAPRAALRMNVVRPEPDEWVIGFGPGVAADRNLSPLGDLVEAAANLFAILHEADEKPRIAVTPVPNTGLGRAINDRLARAAAPRDTES